MVFKVVWSRSALRELREIKDYIAADNPNAAKNVVREIEEQVDLLQTLPFGFPAYVPVSTKTRGTRWLVAIAFSTESSPTNTASAS